MNQLAIDLNRLNSEVLRDQPRSTLTSFLEMLREVFHNQLRYRCLMLSLVHVMKQNKVVSARHKETQRARADLLAANIAALAEAGHLRNVDAAEEAQLAETIALIARFWISEATISYRSCDAKAQVDHYLSLIGRMPSRTPHRRGRTSCGRTWQPISSSNVAGRRRGRRVRRGVRLGNDRVSSEMSPCGDY